MKKILILLLYSALLFGFPQKNIEKAYNEGIFYKNPEITLITQNTITDSLQNPVSFSKILAKSNNFFVAYASPYTWAGCSGQSINLLNSLASKYPGQVILIVENSYYKETIKDLRKAKLNKNVVVLLDTDATNIAKFNQLSKNFETNWYFVINNTGKVLFARTKSSNIKISEQKRKEITEYIYIKLAS